MKRTFLVCLRHSRTQWSHSEFHSHSHNHATFTRFHAHGQQPIFIHLGPIHWNVPSLVPDRPNNRYRKWISCRSVCVGLHQFSPHAKCFRTWLHLERCYVTKVVYLALRSARPWRARVTSVRLACLYHYRHWPMRWYLPVWTLPRRACLHALCSHKQIACTTIHTFLPSKTGLLTPSSPGLKTWQWLPLWTNKQLFKVIMGNYCTAQFLRETYRLIPPTDILGINAAVAYVHKYIYS